MKVKYYKDADLLSIRVSKKLFEYAVQEGDVIVHYTKKGDPVLIEILDAADFLKKSAQVLPVKLKRDIFSESTAVAHRIK